MFVVFKKIEKFKYKFCSECGCDEPPYHDIELVAHMIKSIKKRDKQ